MKCIVVSAVKIRNEGKVQIQFLKYLYQQIDQQGCFGRHPFDLMIYTVTGMVLAKRVQKLILVK
jgi:hypothetical protein